MPAGRERLEELVRTHDGFVRSLAVQLAPIPGAADDIAQEVFLEFLAKRDEWDLSTDVRPLLASMTRVVALRHWSERTRRMSPAMRELADYVRGLAERQPPPEEQSEARRAALARCIEKLPPRGRELLELHYSQGIASVELAGKLDMTAAAVRRALFRLRGQLRKCAESVLAGGKPNV